MKRILFLGLFLMLMSIKANAQVIPFEYTGITASNTDEPYYWQTTIAEIGGANDEGGQAEQFKISSATNISELVANITVFPSGNVLPAGPNGYEPAPPSTMTMYYKLYEGSFSDVFGTVPNVDNLLLTSESLTFTDSQAQYTENNVVVPFDITLQPGTYWLAETGSGTYPTIETTQSYIDPPIVTPEPSTWLLLCLGLGLVGLMRKVAI